MCLGGRTCLQSCDEKTWLVGGTWQDQTRRKLGGGADCIRPNPKRIRSSKGEVFIRYSYLSY